MSLIDFDKKKREVVIIIVIVIIIIIIIIIITIIIIIMSVVDCEAMLTSHRDLGSSYCPGPAAMRAGV